MERCRLRDLGIRPGELEPGPLNAITDVEGVAVGHVTLIEDAPRVVRSGVTVIRPHGGNITEENCFAGLHVLNGNGEMTGLAFVEEFGRLASPIALTGTFSVGAAHEGLVKAEIVAGLTQDFVLPVVAETYDGWLSEGDALAVRPEHVLEALSAASGGPVAEGNVGGGTGMICHEFKGGTGTASRRIATAAGNFTLGALVQANYGRRRRLRLDGVPVGREIPVSEVPAPWPEERLAGSIIVILATDAPLLPHQLRRLAQRAGLGLGRVGGVGETGSGDLFLAFSTAERLPPLDEGQVIEVAMLRETALNALYDGAIEASEEAIWNALTGARTLSGKAGREAREIPLGRLREVIARHASRLLEPDG
jgi:D-aminopeptidase